jgi:hypothetical protein
VSEILSEKKAKFNFYLFNREEDQLDLAAFLKGNSRLGKFIILSCEMNSSSGCFNVRFLLFFIF